MKIEATSKQRLSVRKNAAARHAEALDEAIALLQNEFHFAELDMHDLAKRIKERWPRSRGGQAGVKRPTAQSMDTNSAIIQIKLGRYYAARRKDGRLNHAELEHIIKQKLERFPHAGEEEVRANIARSWGGYRRRRRKIRIKA